MALSLIQIVSGSNQVETAQLSNSVPARSDVEVKTSELNFEESLLTTVAKNFTSVTQVFPRSDTRPDTPPTFSILALLAQQLTGSQIPPSKNGGPVISPSIVQNARLGLLNSSPVQGGADAKLEKSNKGLFAELSEIAWPSARTDPQEQRDTVSDSDYLVIDTHQVLAKPKAAPFPDNKPTEPDTSEGQVMMPKIIDEKIAPPDVPVVGPSEQEVPGETAATLPTTLKSNAESIFEARLDRYDTTSLPPITIDDTKYTDRDKGSEDSVLTWSNDDGLLASLNLPTQLKLERTMSVKKSQSLDEPPAQASTSDEQIPNSKVEAKTLVTHAPLGQFQDPNQQLGPVSNIRDDRLEAGIKLEGQILETGAPVITSKSEGDVAQPSSIAPKTTSNTIATPVPANLIALSEQPQLWHQTESITLDGTNLPTGSTSFTSTTSLAQASAPMPPPAHISTQIRNALEVSGSRDIEIRLDPEELGRVRIVLSPKDGGMSVVFFSDRPEVLDLMRRNSGLLESDFSDIGYESASFSFQQDRNEPHQTTQDTQGQWEMEPPVDQPISHQPQSIGKDTRLDLRF
jgi:flagellar hook-length control protein FliK